MIQDAPVERKLAQEILPEKHLEVEGAEGGAQRMAKEYLDTPYSCQNIKENKLKGQSCETSLNLN